MNQSAIDDIVSGTISKNETTFFHIYLSGESPITHNGFKEISVKDYATFIHEYVHYIQLITTPYGLKYSKFFMNNLFLFREFIGDNEILNIPVKMEEDIPWARELESELRNKNGSKTFVECNIGDVEVAATDIEKAKIEDTAVNIGVYDFDNQRVFSEGFQFGYTCVMESMADLVQSLINSEFNHSNVPYKAAQLICNRIRPDLKDDTKLLIAICLTALFFDNPGYAFFEILESASTTESGVELFHRYMNHYGRKFRGKDMLNYQMMHILMDEFTDQWEELLGCKLVFMKRMMENCKYESEEGISVLLNLIYFEDLSSHETLTKLLDFYGYPAIDSKNSELVCPRNPDTNKPYVETGALLSLELIYARFKELGNNKVCIRYETCDRITREIDKELIDEHCAGTQWEKQLPCLFTAGLSYYKLSEKKIVQE